MRSFGPVLLLGSVVSACSNSPTPPTAPVAAASATATTSTTATRYAIPKCPLRYHVKSMESSKMAGTPAGAMPQELGVFITLEARPTDRKMELTGTLLSELRTGRHRPFRQPDSAYAPTRLETDGSQWKEVDGPTSLFGRFGTQDGLVWLFPKLPSSDRPGSTVEWVVTRPKARDVMKVEIARSSRKGLEEALKRSEGIEEPASDPVRATVRFERWTGEGDARVAELSMTAATNVEGSQEMGADTSVAVRGHYQYRGKYAVTAQGRVLRAELEREGSTDMTLTRSGKPSGPQHYDQRSSLLMHLVDACDGPTERSLETPLSREERAIDAWGRSVIAMHGSDREPFLAAFHPTLRKKLGDAKIWDAFKSFVDLRGKEALLPALLVKDEDVVVNGSTLRLATTGSTRDPKGATNHVDVIVQFKEENGTWLIESVRADAPLEKAKLLAVSSDGISIPKGWPPR